MKLLMLSGLLALSFSVQAQSHSDEQQIIRAVEELRLAMVNGDRALLDKVAAAALSYGHSGGKVEDKAAFVESLASGKSDFVTIDLKNQTIKISGKTALVRHQLHAITNDGAKPGEVHLGVLLVWQKEKKDWKLLARQAFKLP